MNFMKSIALVLALALCLVAIPASAQTALVITTLSGGVINPTPSGGTPPTSIPLTATTGLTARSYGGFTSWLLVDQEIMGVVSVAANPITVVRGQSGTAVTSHRSGAQVYLILSRNTFVGSEPVGQCVRTTLPIVPVVAVVGAQARRYDCLGVTTQGQYLRTDAPGPPVLGSTVTPASTIALTGTIFATDSGATAIVTITVPAGWAPGMCFQMIPGGTGATTTAGNIGLVTSALVVGRVQTFCWNGSKWYPSYVS